SSKPPCTIHKHLSAAGNLPLTPLLPTALFTVPIELAGDSPGWPTAPDGPGPPGRAGVPAGLSRSCPTGVAAAGPGRGCRSLSLAQPRVLGGQLSRRDPLVAYASRLPVSAPGGRAHACRSPRLPHGGRSHRTLVRAAGRASAQRPSGTCTRGPPP